MFIVSADSPAMRIRVTILGGVARFKKRELGVLMAEGYAQWGAESRSLDPCVKDEKPAQSTAGKGQSMVRGQRTFQVRFGKQGKNDEGNDFPNNIYLGLGKRGMADAVRRDLQAIIKERGAPADDDHCDQGGGFVLQLAIPSEGLENIEDYTQADRQECCGMQSR